MLDWLESWFRGRHSGWLGLGRGNSCPGIGIAGANDLTTPKDISPWAAGRSSLIKSCSALGARSPRIGGLFNARSGALFIWVSGLPEAELMAAMLTPFSMKNTWTGGFSGLSLTLRCCLVKNQKIAQCTKKTIQKDKNNLSRNLCSFMYRKFHNNSMLAVVLFWSGLILKRSRDIRRFCRVAMPIVNDKDLRFYVPKSLLSNLAHEGL